MKKQKNAYEAENQREYFRQNPDKVTVAYKQRNSVIGTLNALSMCASSKNKSCIKKILLDSGFHIETINRRANQHSYTIEEVKQACTQATYMAQALHFLGLTIHTINYRKIRTLIDNHNIDTSHWNSQINSRKYLHEEIFCEDSPISRTDLRKKVKMYNVLNLDSCSCCGINEWMGEDLSVQIDHINGNSRDNRIENLRALCPNCHSQTTTYGGKRREHL